VFKELSSLVCKLPYILAGTVKPTVTTTSEQQLPVNNGQFGSSRTSLNLTFIRPHFQNGHFFQVPMVAVEHSFGSTSKNLKAVLSVTVYIIGTL
jgi:hypothetical protein